jgi:hypothetical protein
MLSSNIEHFASNRTLIDADKISRSKFVSGHFGRMPIDHMKSPSVFCLLRDPVERFISYFKYTTGYITSKEDAQNNLEMWLYGEQSDKQANLQSKFLTGKTNIHEFNRNIGNFDAYINNEWHLEGYSLDMDSIKESISNMNIYTMENYNLFIDQFNLELKKQFGFTSFKYNEKSNESPSIKIEISKKDRDRILELNLVDYEVYDYVRSNEKK